MGFDSSAFRNLLNMNHPWSGQITVRLITLASLAIGADPATQEKGKWIRTQMVKRTVC